MSSARKLAEEYAVELYPMHIMRPSLTPEENVDVRTCARKQIAATFLAGFAACVEEARKLKQEHVTHIRIVQGAGEYVKNFNGCVLLDDLEALLKEGEK
jgi:hypothetical protein